MNLSQNHSTASIDLWQDGDRIHRLNVARTDVVKTVYSFWPAVYSPHRVHILSSEELSSRL